MDYKALDPASPEARLRVALALKAARYLAGQRVSTSKQDKAASITTGDLANAEVLKRNGVTRNRLESLEQMKEREGPARPWELAMILEALGGRDQLLHALEPLIGTVTDTAPTEPALVVRLDSAGVDALAAVIEGRRAGATPADAVAAADLLAQALRQAAQERQRQLAEQPRTRDAPGRPGQAREADA